MLDREASRRRWPPLQEWPLRARRLALALSYGLLAAGLWAMVKGDLLLRVLGLLAFGSSLPLTVHVGHALMRERTRSNDRRYLSQFAPAMLVYMALMMFVWPLQKGMPNGALKAGIALLPVLPILWFIVASARHVLGSDELQRRQHLEALAIGVALVSTITMVLGYLAAADVIKVDGALAMMMVYPGLCFTYGVARCWLFWRSGCE